MNPVNPGYSYKGFVYNVEHDIEPDNVKMFHFVTTELPSKVNVIMDWSPYSTPSEADFQLFIDLNLPKRVGSGPLNRQDLMRILEGGDNVERNS